MSTQQFSKDPDYLESIRGLHQLHALTVAGRDEGPEADLMRASLEGPWWRLSDAPKRRIIGLSEDLYSISDPPAEAEPMNPQAQRKLVEALDAREAKEWDKALELLRRWGRYLEPALLSYLRGTIWAQAGDFSTATLFLRHAAEREPNNERYADVYLCALAKSDPNAALEQARQILTMDEAHPPTSVVRAAEIRIMSVRGMSDVDAKPILHELISVLERTVTRLQGDEAQQSSTYVRTVAATGLCYERLGDSRTAERYYNLAIAVDPINQAFLTARGILRYSRDVAGAVDDFQKAIGYGSQLVWPYFYLAHHYLVGKRFEECHKMCERALDMPASDTVRGHLYEWLAIARSELGFPPSQVRAAFEEAIRLEPANDRIRRNFRAFEESLAQQPVLPKNWEKPTESLVQELGHAESDLALAA